MEPMADASTYEKRILQYAWQKKLPVNGNLELLPLCNMNCDMCYVRLSRKEMNRIGKLRSAKEWLSLGKEMKNAGVIFLLLTGGEPLLHPEFREIYLGLKALGMIISINSNGTLIDEDWAAFFEENPPRRINITLYGTDTNTYEQLCHYPGGYERTINGIQLLKKHGIDIRIGCSITQKNIQNLDAFFQIRDELDLYGIADSYMVPSFREREQSRVREVRLSPEQAAACRVKTLRYIIGKERWPSYVSTLLWEAEHLVPSDSPGGMICYAGNCSFSISWLGDMHPCVTMKNPSANVFDIGFEAAWNHLISETETIRVSAQCSRCKYRIFCQSCAGNAMAETGHFDGTPEYLCSVSDAFYHLMQDEAENLGIIYEKKTEGEHKS